MLVHATPRPLLESQVAVIVKTGVARRHDICRANHEKWMAWRPETFAHTPRRSRLRARCCRSAWKGRPTSRTVAAGVVQKSRPEVYPPTAWTSTQTPGQVGLPRNDVIRAWRLSARLPQQVKALGADRIGPALGASACSLADRVSRLLQKRCAHPGNESCSARCRMPCRKGQQVAAFFGCKHAPPWGETNPHSERRIRRLGWRGTTSRRRPVCGFALANSTVERRQVQPLPNTSVRARAHPSSNGDPRKAPRKECHAPMR
jgi:hypothetical protein